MGTIEEITLLYGISKALDVSRNLRESLYKVLDILARSTEMERGTITIMNPLRDEVRIEVAHGLSRTAMQRGKYKAGEGITGKVIETGKSFIVPKVSEEPLFLNRTATRRSVVDQEISFICVPVKKGHQVVGTLSVDIPFDESYLLKEGERL
ncbi:MAG: GAF domain-containing protein, partial [Deltaproteobacteria bacterium]|nr:GAF domain-containing protein [Deltaproteobacteria bacterium]